MIEAVLCILCNVAILFAFRQIGNKGVPRYQALVVNYIAASITGFLFFGSDLTQEILSQILWPIGLGFGFILVFNLMASLTHRIGMGPSSMIIKLSVVIPTLSAFILYDDHIGFLTILGIAAALVALYLTSEPGNKHVNPGWLALGVFLGAGSIDALLNFLQRGVASEEQFGIFSSLIFLFAAFWGFLYVLRKREVSSFADQKIWLWGILLGIPNFGSVYFLLLALERSFIPAGGLFPFINVSIVLLSTAAGWSIFSEKGGIRKGLGIGLGIISLVLIAYGG